MLPLLHVDIVNGREEVHIVNRETRLFLHFTCRTTLEGFAPFEVPTRESQGAFNVLVSFQDLEGGYIGTCAMATLPFADDKLALCVENKDSYANGRIHGHG